MLIKNKKILCSYSLAMATTRSDNNIVLVISYYIDLHEVGRLIYIYKIKKLLIFNNAE